jgi:4'-phosphopantetheinyl transferase
MVLALRAPRCTNSRRNRLDWRSPIQTFEFARNCPENRFPTFGLRSRVPEKGRGVATLTIDLWFWRLDAAEDDVRRLSRHLSEDETARAARFVRPEHGRDFTVGRGRLREILADWTGTRPQDLRFGETGKGKPSLADGPEFNLTHSGGWAGLALSPDLPVGLDLEAWRPVERDVAERFFSPRESAEMRKLAGRLWQQAFFRVWTRKEAVIKALGTGLFHDLASFDVTLAPGAAARIDRIEGDDPAAWSLIDLAPADNVAGSLALRAEGCPVEIRVREGQLPFAAR